MPKIVLIEENPEQRARLEHDLKARGLPVVAVARWEDYRPTNGDSPRAAPVKLREIERAAIEEALRATHGNRTHAANILGISIRTLRNKLNEYSNGGVPIPPPNGGELRGAA
jgi:DNA-binding NtrC family response regulator